MFYLLQLLSRVTMVVAILLAAVVWLGRRPAVQTEVAPVEAPVDPPRKQSIEGSSASALAVAEQFTRAGSHEDRLKWVRQPSEVTGAMADFFSSGAGSLETVTELIPLGVSTSGTLTYECIGARMSSGKRRLLCVVPDVEGERIDFHAYALHGSQSWAALLSGEAQEASEMRVLLQCGDYYNFNFSEETRWRNFTCSSPDLEQPLEFYLERSHPALKQLEELDLQSPARVIVSIRSVGDSHLKGQFEITRLLAAGWVLPE